MSSSAFAVALAVLCVAVGVKAAKCPNHAPMAGFDISKARGQWFVQKTSVSGLVLPSAKCMMRSYNPGANDTLEVHVDYLDPETGDSKDANLELVSSPSSPASFTVKNVYVNDIHVVVNTDYTKFAIFYACISLADCEGSYVIGLTRERTMTPDVALLLDIELTKAGLNDGLVTVSQENCV